EIQIVLIMLGIAQRSRLGVYRILLLADIRVAQDAKSFRISGHDSIFDSVMNHFHKMPRAVRAAVKISLLAGSAELFASGGSRNLATPRRERAENGIEPLYDVIFAPDHHAVAALQAPPPATGSYIYLMYAFAAQFIGAANVVNVIGIAA